jgi:hypothetical protein
MAFARNSADFLQKKLAAACAMLGVCGPALAQALPPDAVVAAPQDAPPPEPETTTITVRGGPPPHRASEVVVEKRVLQAAPHKDAAEMLLTVPGVFVSQHGGPSEGRVRRHVRRVRGPEQRRLWPVARRTSRLRHRSSRLRFR